MKFGELIKKQREKRGISVLKLAKRLEMDSSNLTKVEHGKISLPDDRIRLLAKILKIDTALLFLYAYREKVPEELHEYFNVKIKPKLLREATKKIKKLSPLEKKAVIEVVDSFKDLVGM